MVDMEMINRMVANCEAAIAQAEALLETDLSGKYVMGWESTALFVKFNDNWSNCGVSRVFNATDITSRDVETLPAVKNGNDEFAQVMSLKRALKAEIRERNDVLEILRKDIIEKYNAEMEG